MQSDGSVIVSGPDGIYREFQADSRGSDYFDQPGDTGTLIKNGDGTFSLQEADGSLTHFLADGRVDYDEDTNGNRITAGYTNGLLTGLTRTDGQSLEVAYNSAGRITQVTDPYGRKTLFTYDPTGTYLLSVQNADGTMQTYTYDTATGPADNALASATTATGLTQSFAYNAQGWLSGISENNGADPISFAYGPAGEVDETDATGDTTRLFFDNRGLLVKMVDPLGNPTYQSFDAKFNLVSTTDATGQSYDYTYDSSGNLTSITDPAGKHQPVHLRRSLQRAELDDRRERERDSIWL